MIQSYLKTILRNLHKHAGYTFINIAGLAVGLACCILIVLFIRQQVTYDRFHAKADHIYRIVTDVNGQNGQVTEMAFSSAPMAVALVEDFPEIVQATRLFGRYGVMRTDEQSSDAEQQMQGVTFVDSTFFEVFDFQLVQGDRTTALQAPNTIILSETLAERYFGDADPLGQSLVFSDTLRLRVTGVMVDMPSNSHIQAGALASLHTLPVSAQTNYGRLNLWTYLVLAENASASALVAKLPDFAEQRIGEWARTTLAFHLQPLTSIYFDSDRLAEIGPTGDRTYLYIFSAIGLFVLIVACINFMNLATARSFRRAREVGVRKVLGAHRGQLVRQFLGEALLLVFVGFAAAIGLVEVFLPTFSELASQDISVDYRQTLGYLFAITLLVGLAAGSYPAFFLSAFEPVAVLKGKVHARASGRWVRKGLVVIQFSITIILLIGTTIVYSQLDYVQNKRLGFNEDQVFVVQLQNTVQYQHEVLKRDLLRQPQVAEVAAASALPGMPVAPNAYTPEGSDPQDGPLMTNTIPVGYDYLEVLEVPLLAGRSFSPDFLRDVEEGFIINASAIGHFGWASPEEALGKQLTRLGTPHQEGRVIGVIDDYHYASLHSEIQPLVLRMDQRFRFLAVRVNGDQLIGAREAIEATWQAFAPTQPFQGRFLDDDLERLYLAEQRFGEVFGYFAGMAIIIACLGLFGLAAFTAEQRTKEIGVRKVLGASIPSVSALLAKEYVYLVLLANLIAWPTTYVVMLRWLDNFVYRIDLGVGVFLLGTLVALTIALLTVSYQAIKAALADPVNVLRYE